MTIDDLIGHLVTLRVERIGPQGAFLETEERPKAILLPGTEAPKTLKEGDAVEVFVYLDSEDRPIATIRAPRLMLGEVAFLEVTDVTRIGAFVDWGLPKELLVPFAEQTRDMRLGERYAIGLKIDDTHRPAGTMRVSEMLRAKPTLALDEWIEGEAWRHDPRLGTFVIVQRKFVGLVPMSEPHTLAIGAPARVRVTNILPDGKIELSLRGLAHEELDRDADHILAKLALPAAPKMNDHSSPEQIRSVFGLSKKAFKRAVGRLLQTKRVMIGPDGFLGVLVSSDAPR